ncbi:ribosome recycling factor [bacterium]|nr:ribosome recycling factor [bacterium]
MENTYKEIVANAKEELNQALASFKEEVSKIRSGRVSAAFVEDIKVDCFGSIMPIKQLGAVSVVSNREIEIQLWDKSYLDSTVKAIEEENLGFGVRTESNNIYLSAPPLSEETRKNLIAVLAKKKEEFFQEIRRIRDKAWKEIQNKFREGEIREDDKYRGRDDLDKAASECKEKMEEAVKNKEEEIKG